MRVPAYTFFIFLTSLLLTACASQASAVANTEHLRPLEVTDIMQFREIEQRAISDDGAVLAYTASPDWGDVTGYVVRVADQTTFSVPRGTAARINALATYVSFVEKPELLRREQASTADERKALVDNVVLVRVSDGEQTRFENVRQAAFTGDGQTLVLMYNSDEAKEGYRVVFHRLDDGRERAVENVAAFSVADEGPRVALHFIAKDDGPGRVAVRNTQNNSQLVLRENVGAADVRFTFNEEGTHLAFLAAAVDSDKDASGRDLWLWAFGQQVPSQLEVSRDGWEISQYSNLRWTHEDSALFFGMRPIPEPTPEKPAKPETEADLYNLDWLLSDRRLQVWHGDDERIIPHQRETHRQRTRATADTIYWLNEARWVALTDNVEATLSWTSDAPAAVVVDASQHLRPITWDGFYHNLYHVDLRSGDRQAIAERVPSSQRGLVSPDGRYVTYVHHDQIHLFDAQTGESQVVGADAGVSWVDEENDRPMEASTYGFGGWLADSSAFYVYDRFDIWHITPTGRATNVSRGVGRDSLRTLRIQAKPEGLYDAGEALLVRSFHERLKTSGFHRLDPISGQLVTLVEGEKSYALLEQLPEQNRVFFTEQDFRQFPDIQVADLNFAQPMRLTDVNPQQSEFIWGHAELLEWESTHGEPLQGVLIKPDNYDASKQYPVMVYYYEKFSQRLYNYNQMRVNHRPNFPFYLGQGYLVFLPDIHFRLGAPGPSATESLVPGVQKLIDQGIADPNAIGLHGHSWSGYQTAFVVTETDMFAAAVAGAPVSNMTSAYSGIRWGSGLARQFQYEQGQSRLGVSMFDDLTPYIDNSPVFFADRINTPMLIQFGDKDEAVPWEQGIEYYLALRRLDKPVVMLHYEGELHHLRRYANKIDYTIKMLEFFDHYLKGEEAPTWWTEGLEYQVYD
ncbi:MAG: S9 family peptidase [Idiomarina sp.]|nr:S9 family peptidase [Idiomarina sp.]